MTSESYFSSPPLLPIVCHRLAVGAVNAGFDLGVDPQLVALGVFVDVQHDSLELQTDLAVDPVDTVRLPR